ncbi:MAG TPA: hypothetical protein VFT98_04700 [Myxococcota bacterium]|nr:hypothetical protein [Myxococcota bacterium]
MTVVMTGTWNSVADTAGVLDGSVIVGGSFTATFIYDDQVADCEPFVGIGCFLMNGSTGALSFSTGSYSFADQGVSQNGVGLEDSVQGMDIVGLFFDRFVASGPLPNGVALAPLAYANPTLTDLSETALSSDQLIDIPWGSSLWDSNFYFFGPVTGRGPQDYVEFSGTISSITTILPEPALGMLWISAATILLAAKPRD